MHTHNSTSCRDRGGRVVPSNQHNLRVIRGRINSHESHSNVVHVDQGHILSLVVGPAGNVYPLQIRVVVRGARRVPIGRPSVRCSVAVVAIGGDCLAVWQRGGPGCCHGRWMVLQVVRYKRNNLSRQPKNHKKNRLVCHRYYSIWNILPGSPHCFHL